MSAFGGYGYGDLDAFEAEEGLDEPLHESIPHAHARDDPAASLPRNERDDTAAETVTASSHAFDDEEEIGMPLDESVQSRLTETRNFAPQPNVSTTAHLHPSSPLTMSLSSFSGYSPSPHSPMTPSSTTFSSPAVHNPLQPAHPSTAQAAQAAQAAQLTSSSSMGQMNPLATSQSQNTLARLHNAVPTFQDSKLALDALWALSSNSDPAFYAHAVYAQTAHISRGEVSVSEPEKRNDALSSFIVYKVKSSIETRPGSIAEATVYRRYSDFLWLHEQLFLAQHLAGFLLPPIPDKAVMGRFGEDFVEDRRRTLELFIKRVVAHPVLRAQEEVQAFLSAADPVWNVARKQHRKQVIPGLQPAQGGGVLGFLKGKAQLPGSKHVAASPDDALCEKADEYAAKLEHELTQLDNELDKLMQREKATARTWVELGMACGQLSQTEGTVNEKSNVAVFSTLGSMSDQVAVIIARTVELERQGIRDCIKDHIRLSESVQTMMKLRGVVSNNYYEALNKLEALQKRGPGKDPGAHSKLLAEAQQTLNLRQTELQECTNRARVEFGRFQKEKSRALKQAAVHFVQLQIEQAKNCEAAWNGVLASL